MHLHHVVATQIIDWLDSQNLECLYKGIQFDCAMALKIAPSNPAFVAAWNRIRFTVDGNNRPVAYL